MTAGERPEDSARSEPRALHWLWSRHHLLSAGTLAVCLLPLLWIARYNYPSGDDYLILLKGQRLGTWGATVDWYTGWTGRYTTFFFLSALARHTDWFLSYRLLPAGLLFAGLASSYAFVAAMTRSALDRRSRFSLVACFYVVLIAITPDITTAFYWTGSNVMYSGGVFASVLAVALHIRLLDGGSRRKRWGLTLAVVCVVAAVAGLNEISLLLLAAVFVWINLLHLVRQRRVHAEGGVALASVVVFGALSLLAPGNTVRAERVGAEAGAVAGVFGSAVLPVYLLFELVCTTPLLPLTILYIAFLQRHKAALDNAFTRWAEPRWPVIALLMAGSLALVAVPVFSTVGVTSLVDRVKNVYVMSLCFAWLYLITALVADLWHRRMTLEVPRWVSVTLAVFVLGFLATGFRFEVHRSRAATAADAVHPMFALVDTGSVYTDAYLDLLSGRAKRYADVNAARERRLRSADGDTVELPLHSYVPETIFVQDVNHPWSVAHAMSEVFSGSVKTFKYVETGPPAALKRKF